MYPDRARLSGVEALAGLEPAYPVLRTSAWTQLGYSAVAISMLVHWYGRKSWPRNRVRGRNRRGHQRMIKPTAPPKHLSSEAKAL